MSSKPLPSDIVKPPKPRSTSMLSNSPIKVEEGAAMVRADWDHSGHLFIQDKSAYDYLVEAIQAHSNGEPIPLLIPSPP